MNRGPIFALLCGALCLSSVTAMAEDDVPCAAIYDDSSNSFALGPWPIGMPAPQIMSHTALEACSEQNGLSDDCYLSSPDGVDYIIWRDDKGNGTVADAHLSSRSTASSGTSPVPLPVGIAFGWSREQVREKLRQLPAGFPAWRSISYDSADASPMLVTDACLRSGYGDLWRLRLHFDANDRLDGISTSQRDFTPIT